MKITKITRKELDAIVRDIAGGAAADRAEESRAKSVEPKPGQHLPGLPKGNQKEEREFDPSTRVARVCRYLYQAQGNKHYALDLANKAKDEQVIKAMGESLLADGGAMIEGDFASDIIPVLRAQSVIRSLGPRSAPMPSGALSMPYGATGSSSGYVGESEIIQESQPTLGQINFVAKKLAAIVPTSNELLADSSGRGDAFIRDDIAAGLSAAENLQLIRGNPSSAAPTSLKKLSTVSGTTFAANATVSLPNTTKDLAEAIRRIEEQDVVVTKGGWIASIRTKYYLLSVRDSSGNAIWADEIKAGMLMGYPIRFTNAIPSNLGGGLDESEVYFGNYDSLVLAETASLSVEVFPGGAYASGGGVISGISQDQTVVRAIARHDFNSRYRGKDVTYISAVKWA